MSVVAFNPLFEIHIAIVNDIYISVPKVAFNPLFEILTCVSFRVSRRLLEEVDKLFQSSF